MTYELLLKLKEAGYEQRTRGACPHEIKELERQHATGEIETIYFCRCGGNVHHPTLEELIQACGDEIESIHNVIKDEYNSGWWKVMGRSRPQQFNAAPTLSDALAQFWLELNKKDE